ncbi:hypothetical protein BV455_01604 [Parageobacillus caldoxylosilyticus]|uniref:helix-turn-helix domain-containing protein n=1 Tax=Saccharococcus caldoxylosilyticus TaxID=81408 RepID=UPI001C4DFFDE|nr:helix-turn-helix domain-containing protein [Parageobacillus caldoxylosilyticus]QXJ38290.1 hypothetical protein BV455_01604 [Parageobacillus caldoxylosilyticus]
MENLRELETFSSVEEMDNFISEVLEYFDLCELDRRLLRLLAGHSCKFIGVSWLKVESMADALGVSYKTVQRALKRLKELGIIKRIRTLRPTRGGFGASITIICPIELTYREEATKEAPEGTQEASARKETFYFKTYSGDIKYTQDIKYIRQQAELDYSYLTEFVPEEFIQVVKPFVSPEEAYSLWGKVQVVAKKYAPSVLDIVEPAIRAFKASVLAYKMRRIKKSFGAYFWGALSGIFSVEQRRVAGAKLWNWLGE